MFTFSTTPYNGTRCWIHMGAVTLQAANNVDHYARTIGNCTTETGSGGITGVDRGGGTVGTGHLLVVDLHHH